MKPEITQKDQRLISIFKSAKTEYTEDFIVIPIPNIFSKKFTAFCSMREDLLMIKQYTLKLDLEKEKIIKSALTYSIISSYGKCFTDASKTKSPKLEENEVFKENPEYLRTHNKIMELRHKFIAHRGDTESEVVAAFILIPKKDNSVVNIKFKRLKQISFSNTEHIEIRNLIDFLINKLDPKIEKAAEKAKRGMFETFTLEQLALMDLNNIND